MFFSIPELPEARIPRLNWLANMRSKAKCFV